MKKPEDEQSPDEPGADSGTSESADRPPAAPADDESPAGDTDQHSDA